MDTYAALKDLQRRVAALEAASTPAAELRVDFASAPAAELADKLDLTPTDFADTEASGATGLTVPDVKATAKRKRKP